VERVTKEAESNFSTINCILPFSQPLLLRAPGIMADRGCFSTITLTCCEKLLAAIGLMPEPVVWEVLFGNKFVKH